MVARTLALIGQWLGVVSAVTVLLLVVWSLAAPPAAQPNLNLIPLVVPAAVAAVCALLGAWHRSPTILTGAFLLAFLPWVTGPTLLASPDPFRFIPLAEGGYLVAALLLRRPRPRTV